MVPILWLPVPLGEGWGEGAKLSTMPFQILIIARLRLAKLEAEWRGAANPPT